MQRLRHGKAENPRWWRRHRARACQWQGYVCILLRLYSPRWISIRDLCRKNLQDHGQGSTCWGTMHRSQWLRWCKNLGGHRISGWICRDIPAQCRFFRSHSPNFPHHGTLCRRSCILSCSDWFCVHGSRLELYVCHWPRCGQDCNKWGGHQGRAWWSQDA